MTASSKFVSTHHHSRVTFCCFLAVSPSCCLQPTVTCSKEVPYFCPSEDRYRSLFLIPEESTGCSQNLKEWRIQSHSWVQGAEQGWATKKFSVFCLVWFVLENYMLWQQHFLCPTLALFYFLPVVECILRIFFRYASQFLCIHVMYVLIRICYLYGIL